MLKRTNSRRPGLPRPRRGRFGLVVTVILFYSGPIDAVELANQTRDPVAIAVVGENTLVTANSASGTVSLIDVATESVVAEVDVGGRPVDITAVGGNQLAVVDQQGHRVSLYDIEDGRLVLQSRHAVPPFPVHGCLAGPAANGRVFAVSSLWSESVSVGLIGGSDAQWGTIRLPFAPHRIVAIPRQNRLIVADAFGGQLAVVGYEFGADSKARLELQSVREFRGHNIGYLVIREAKTGRQLLISQMIANRLAQPLRDEVHWGSYIASALRTISLDAMLDPSAAPQAATETMTLGEPGHGSADPGPFLFDESGTMAVAFAGTDQVALFDPHGVVVGRVTVGRNPVAMISLGASRLAVINRFDQSVSMIRFDASRETKFATVSNTISLGPSPEESPVRLGQRLFHSAGLSHDGWMSCHSCHTDGHTSGIVVDTISDGDLGAAKRVLSLLGLAGTEPFGWTGTMDLHTQIEKSIRQTLHGQPADRGQVDALVAYIRSIPPPPRREGTGFKPVDASAVARGKKLFQTRDCQRCHAGPAKTSPQNYDVGLTDAIGNRTFNPPSLRGVAYRSHFFHDGRANGLREVFTRYKHPDQREFSDRQLDDLSAYLLSL